MPDMGNNKDLEDGCRQDLDSVRVRPLLFNEICQKCNEFGLVLMKIDLFALNLAGLFKSSLICMRTELDAPVSLSAATSERVRGQI